MLPQFKNPAAIYLPSQTRQSCRLDLAASRDRTSFIKHPNQKSLMKRTFLLCAALLTALPLTLLAKDFPLEFKSLTAPDGLSLPGGGGISGSLQLEKPGAITREPPAESRHPLYGQLSDQTNRLWFRLDESGGTGKSYDRLIMDLNQNGDLTDDAVAMRADKPAPTITTNNERSVFGPIPVPAEMKIGSWRPIYFAQLYLYNLSLALQSGSRRTYIGQLRLRPGWYLETTVELDGMRRKVGIVDSDCSFRLGETSRPQTYESNGEKNWYFAGGDSFLIDSDNSGNFKGSVGNDESAPFGSLLYLGAKPYKVVLAADDKSLAVEPWKGPLAELVLQPHGEQVSAIEVAWESAPDQWQLLQPGVENGKARVPPGSYRLIHCTLKVPAANG